MPSKKQMLEIGLKCILDLLGFWRNGGEIKPWGWSAQEKHMCNMVCSVCFMEVFGLMGERWDMEVHGARGIMIVRDILQ